MENHATGHNGSSTESTWHHPVASCFCPHKCDTKFICSPSCHHGSSFTTSHHVLRIKVRLVHESLLLSRCASDWKTVRPVHACDQHVSQTQQNIKKFVVVSC